MTRKERDSIESGLLSSEYNKSLSGSGRGPEEGRSDDDSSYENVPEFHQPSDEIKEKKKKSKKTRGEEIQMAPIGDSESSREYKKAKKQKKVSQDDSSEDYNH